MARHLTSLYGTWSAANGIVEGPGTLAVIVEDLHKAAASHFDIGFVLNRDRGSAPVLWDCVAGYGAEAASAPERAAETWAASTAPVFLELLVQDGSFASHFHHDDPEGCPGWHVVHGPVIAFGEEAARDSLLQWVLDNPLLPVVGHPAADGFERQTLNCVKLLFGFAGEDTAEVRINGRSDEKTSAILKSLAWPRSGRPAFARLLFLFVHSDQDERSSCVCG